MYTKQVNNTSAQLFYNCIIALSDLYNNINRDVIYFRCTLLGQF